VEGKFRIGELAERTDVTKRTIHYYLSKGLLPPSTGAGVATYYSDEHLYRILLIKKYQEKYLPLEEIKKIITRLTLAEVKEQLYSYEDSSNIMVLESSSNYETGSVYKKMDLIYGIEIYYPADNPNAEELVSKILKMSYKDSKEV